MQLVDLLPVVGLLTVYSNHLDLLPKLRSILNLPQDREPSPPKTVRRARRLNPEQTTELIDRYRAGETVYQLGSAFGIHRSTVGLILKRNNVTLRHPPLTEAQVDEVVRLVASGLSQADVGRRLALPVPRAGEPPPCLGSPAAPPRRAVRQRRGRRADHRVRHIAADHRRRGDFRCGCSRPKKSVIEGA